MRQICVKTVSSSVRGTVCRLFRTKPLLATILIYCQLTPYEQIQSLMIFCQKKCIEIYVTPVYAIWNAYLPKCQTLRFKIQNSFIASYQTQYTV